jgi:SAM-dependent methyltransferase
LEPEAYDEMYRQEASHWWYRGMRTITEKLLQPRLTRDGSLSILDAGCGTGGNLTALAPHGRVTGIDYSSLALSYAARHDHHGLARAGVEALPFRDDTFDLVTSFDVIVHSAVRDDVAALRELARITRPGGLVLIRVAALPALRGPHDTVVHGIRRYTSAELRDKMAQAQLKLIRLTYANSLLLAPILIARKLQDLAVRLGGRPSQDVAETPALLNTLLEGILGIEAFVIKHGYNLPLGVSLIALAAKTE